MIEYTHHKKQYLFATNVSWLDVASQIELEKVIRKQEVKIRVRCIGI